MSASKPTLQDLRAAFAGAQDPHPPPPPSWDLLRDQMRAASTALLKAAEDFWRTLPPGSRVAISRAQTDILPERYEAVRCEWNLRAVFPGQTPPPSPWTTYDFAPPPDERPCICGQDEWNPTCPHFGG